MAKKIIALVVVAGAVLFFVKRSRSANSSSLVATPPPASLALAVIGMVSCVVKLVPEAGSVMFTKGGRFDAIVTLIIALVIEPALLRAAAFNAHVPAGGLLQTWL